MFAGVFKEIYQSVDYPQDKKWEAKKHVERRNIEFVQEILHKNSPAKRNK